MLFSSITKPMKSNTIPFQSVITYLALAILLILLCARVWHFGITHSDDAAWALPGYVLDKDPVSEWAISQGRIWAYISGSMMLFTLKLQGSLGGELLRLGSFILFFICFYWYLAVLISKNFSLLSASFFLAFFMLKWDGSILTTYPLITWVAGIAFIASLESSRRFILNGKFFLIPWIASLLLFSLFNNEGITLLFICLFLMHTLLMNATVDATKIRVHRLKLHQHSIVLLMILFVVATIYSLIYLVWLHLHPSIYDGHKLSGFDGLKFFQTLYHFSTSGSALHDMITPYSVPFGDAINMTGGRIDYFLTRNLQRSLHDPLSLTAGLLTIWLLWIQIKQFHTKPTTTMVDQNYLAKKRKDLKFGLKIGLVVGLSIAIIPIVPVAVTAKYQSWMAENQIRAYSHTIFSHFGWTCVYTVVLLFSLNNLKNRAKLRNVFAILVTLFSGLIASQAFTANDDMAADMRNESGRWQMLESMLAVNDTFFRKPYIWSPRFNSGSWYAVVGKDYWSMFAEKRHGSKTKVSGESPNLDQQRIGYLTHDYTYDKLGKRFVAVATPVDVESMPFAQKNKLAIYIEGGISKWKGDYFLMYKDRQGRETNTALESLQALNSNSEWGLISNIDADISTIKLARLDKKNRQIILCGLVLPRGILMTLREVESDTKTIRMKINDPSVLKEAWSQVEQGGAWTVSQKARMLLPNKIVTSNDLHFKLQLKHLAGQDNQQFSQTLTVRFKDNIVGAWTFAPPQKQEFVEFIVSRKLHEADELIDLTFEVSPTVNQSKVSQNRDTRELGVFIESLQISVVR
jgi:hypothetical protein